MVNFIFCFFTFSPQNLDLTAVSEAVLLDNLNIFEKSGFKFNVSEENSVGQKVQLVSVPVSHNWRFGKEGACVIYIF